MFSWTSSNYRTNAPLIFFLATTFKGSGLWGLGSRVQIANVDFFPTRRVQLFLHIRTNQTDTWWQFTGCQSHAPSSKNCRNRAYIPDFECIFIGRAWQGSQVYSREYFKFENQSHFKLRLHQRKTSCTRIFLLSTLATHSCKGQLQYHSNWTMMGMRMALLIVIGIFAFLSQSNAFSVGKVTSSRMNSFKPLTINSRSSAPVSSTKMSMLPAIQAMAPLSKLILGIPVMYMLFSANEYVTHRYYQHNEIGKMWFYKTLRKFNLFPKMDGGGLQNTVTFEDNSLSSFLKILASSLLTSLENAKKDHRSFEY